MTRGRFRSAGVSWALAASAALLIALSPAVSAGDDERPEGSVSGVVALLRVPANVLPKIGPDGGVIGKEGFFATFVLINHSGEDIPFSLASLCGESKWMQFVLRDPSGHVIWRSLPPLLCPIFMEDKVLAAGTRVLERVWVPLVNGDTALLPGRYELEAFIDGEPRYSAVAPFELANGD